jgi:uncharacterized membrane protein
MLEYLEILKNPPMLHAIVVHTPIALATLGVPLAVLAVLVRRWRALHWFALTTYAIAAAGAYAAMFTGEGAMAVAPNTLSAEAWAHIDAHEELGEIAWIAVLVTLVLLAVMLINHDRLRQITGVLVIIASVATAGIISVTAHRGGMLVYEYGVGTNLVMQPVDAPTPEGGATAELPEPADMEAPNTAALTPQAETKPVVKDIEYTRDIEPVFAEYCYDCHDDMLPDGELDMTNWQNLLAGGEKAGAAVVPGDPGASAIVKYIEGTLQPQMPHKKDALDGETIQLIRDWIAQGAPHPGA